MKMETQINRDKFFINKDIALNEYREYIENNSSDKKRVECSFYKFNFNSNDSSINVSFRKVTSLHLTILFNVEYCKYKDYNISEQSKFFLNSHLIIKNENDLINLINEFNLIVKNCSFKKLEESFLIRNKFPRHKKEQYKGHYYKKKFVNKKVKAKYQKTKIKRLPRQVDWDLGEDLEFIEEHDVKRFKDCFVWYYMYAKKPKYIKRSKTVEKYKLMFERMRKMISEESYLEHLSRSL